MASIRSIGTAEQPRWQVLWREPKRDEHGQPLKGRYNQRSETFDEETQAHVRKQAIEDALDIGIDPKAARERAARTLSSYAADYFDSLPGTGIDGETVDKYRRIYDLYIKAALGTKPVAAIRVSDVKLLRSELAETTSARTGRKLSTATIKHALRLLRAILSTCVEDEVIQTNPAALRFSAATINRQREHLDSRTYTKLTVEQIAAAADYIANDQVQTVTNEKTGKTRTRRSPANPVYGLAILFSAYTGMRREELQGLEIRDLTLPHIPGTTGHVQVQRKKITEHRYQSEPLKSEKAYRTIPLDAWLADDLRAYLADFHQDATNPTAPVFPGRLPRAEGKALGRKVSDPADMFDWTEPIDETHVYKRYWLPALKALGLPHSRWHDHRHTFATYAIQSGENIRDVSRWLGHSKISTTLDIYASVLANEDNAKAAPTSRPVPRARNDAGSNVVQLGRKAQ